MPLPRLIVPPAPAELLIPLSAMELRVSVPWFTDSAPVKVLVPERVQEPVPVLTTERAPPVLSVRAAWNSLAAALVPLRVKVLAAVPTLVNEPVNMSAPVPLLVRVPPPVLAEARTMARLVEALVPV